jgi:hypothetical protein
LQIRTGNISCVLGPFHLEHSSTNERTATINLLLKADQFILGSIQFALVDNTHNRPAYT